jgi:hypothetical protein
MTLTKKQRIAAAKKGWRTRRRNQSNFGVDWRKSFKTGWHGCYSSCTPTKIEGGGSYYSDIKCHMCYNDKLDKHILEINKGKSKYKDYNPQYIDEIKRQLQKVMNGYAESWKKIQDMKLKMDIYEKNRENILTAYEINEYVPYAQTAFGIRYYY